MIRKKNVVSVVRGDGHPEGFVAFVCPEAGCDYDTGDWAVKFEGEALYHYKQHWQGNHAIVPDPVVDRWTGTQQWVVQDA